MIAIHHIFYDSHRLIFQACLEIHEQGQVVDLMTLAASLANSKQLDRVGGKRAISSLFDSCITSANIDTHADLVLDKYQRRCMARVGAEIQRMSKDTSRSVAECLGESQSLFRELLQLSSGDSSVVPL